MKQSRWDYPGKLWIRPEVWQRKALGVEGDAGVWPKPLPRKQMRWSVTYRINTNILKWSCTILVSIKMNEIKTYEFHFDFLRVISICARGDGRKECDGSGSSSSVFLYEPISYIKRLYWPVLPSFYSGDYILTICNPYLLLEAIRNMNIHYILFVCFTECADGGYKWKDFFFP